MLKTYTDEDWERFLKIYRRGVRDRPVKKDEPRIEYIRERLNDPHWVARIEEMAGLNSRYGGTPEDREQLYEKALKEREWFDVKEEWRR